MIKIKGSSENKRKRRFPPDERDDPTAMTGTGDMQVLLSHPASNSIADGGMARR